MSTPSRGSEDAEEWTGSMTMGVPALLGNLRAGEVTRGSSSLRFKKKTEG